MLSGIKTGKRKRPIDDRGAAAGRLSTDDFDRQSSANTPTALPAAAATAASSSFNRSVAEALRADLLSGSPSASNLVKKSNEHAASSVVLSQLEARGRISQHVVSQKCDDDAIVINRLGSANDASASNISSNNLRYNSKGKLSRSQQNSPREQNDANLSITEMLQQELQQHADMDEIYARNIAKMGKSYKKYSNLQHNSKSGADEDDYLQETASVSDRLYRPSSSNAIAPSLQYAKETSRAIAQHSAFEQWKSKSWWWMESPSFDKRHLIALGDKVTLLLVPRRYALVEGHCYIVPLAYSTSFVDLDEEAWHEVSRFQTSLSQMFQNNNMGLIFLETASHASKSGTAGGTQCKLEAIPVSRRVERDAPFYFKSSLEEMAQEWGTHQKLIVLTDRKSLRNAVPKGFPYFYCGWDGGGAGYVQLIEG
ncbi:hypothetical protein ACHAWX_003267, partial [Stephanocyclus meneghinianus]